MVPDDVRGVLPEGLLDSVKEDPRALVDPAAAQALRETVAEIGGESESVADGLLNSLNLALTVALSDVFTVLSVAVALSFPVALFLRVRLTPNGRTDMAGGEHSSAEREAVDTDNRLE